MRRKEAAHKEALVSVAEALSEMLLEDVCNKLARGKIWLCPLTGLKNNIKIQDKEFFYKNLK